MWKVRSYFWMFLVVGMLCTIQAQAQISTRKLEAIYLYNFTKYINFQKASDGYTIGVLQEKGVANELQDNLQNKGGVQVKTISTAAEAEGCHIVYIPKTESSQLSGLVAQLEKSEVLIVTEEDLAKEGAPVSFVVEGSKLRFKINQLALEQTGLKASGSLLNLAILI